MPASVMDADPHLTSEPKWRDYMMTTRHRIRYILAICAFAFLINNSRGDQAETNATIQLVLDLADGSRVIGVPAISCIIVQTTYAKMEIPLNQILNIKITDDQATAVFDLVNGDKLQGVITIRPLKLETVFGKVSLGIEHIRNISVCQTGNGLLPVALKDNLILYYSFDKDDGAKVTDLTGKNDAVVDGAKWMPSGKVGGAMEFTGKNSQMASLQPVGIAGSAQRTLAAWIRCDENPSSKHVWVPVGFGEANSHSQPYLSGTLFSLALYDGNGTIVFLMWGVNAGDVMSAAPVITGRWYHIVAAFDGKTVNLYVDGKLDLSKQVVVDTPPSKLYFSRIWGDYPDRAPFKGAIDEVMIFDRALSGKDVRALFNRKY